MLYYAEGYVPLLPLSQWMFAVFNGIGMVVNSLMLWAARIPTAYLIS